MISKESKQIWNRFEIIEFWNNESQHHPNQILECHSAESADISALDIARPQIVKRRKWQGWGEKDDFPNRYWFFLSDPSRTLHCFPLSLKHFKAISSLFSPNIPNILSHRRSSPRTGPQHSQHSQPRNHRSQDLDGQGWQMLAWQFPTSWITIDSQI